MICVGIDIAKDKHDCCILDSDGTVRADCFTIPNNMDGFKASSASAGGIAIRPRRRVFSLAAAASSSGNRLSASTPLLLASSPMLISTKMSCTRPSRAAAASILSSSRVLSTL